MINEKNEFHEFHEKHVGHLFPKETGDRGEWEEEKEFKLRILLISQIKKYFNDIFITW